MDVMAFMTEFHEKGKLSKHIGASFIALIAKKADAENVQEFQPISHIGDFQPISHIGAIYKVQAKVLASRIQKVLTTLISAAQGTFAHGQQNP